MEWSVAAVILLIVSCIAVGVTSAVVTTWRLRVSLYSLEDAVTVLQGIQTREVKVRAGQERWKRPEKDAAVISELLGKAAAPARPMNWWERNDLPRSADGK